MFKKLRQKIENVEPSPATSSTSSKKSEIRRTNIKSSDINIRRSLNGPLNVTSRSGSLTSLAGSESDTQVNDFSSRDELQSVIFNTTAKLKRMEVKLADYGQALKDRTRECEKLNNALEKSQDSAIRKIRDMSETYSEEKAKFESTILLLETKERELSSHVEKIEFEKDKLEKQLNVFEKDKEEFESRKEEFFQKRDTDEELLDLQKQEIAKLKHMLMNSEKSSNQFESERNLFEKELNELKIESNQQKDDLEKLRASFEDSSSKLITAKDQIEDLKDTNKQNESIIKHMSEDNVNLKEQLSSSVTEVHKIRNKLFTTESRQHDILEKYDTLKHSNECFASKANSDLNEKENLIQLLQDRLKILEKRSNNDKLPFDDQMKALLDERSSLELKLEETSQQLFNIKSSWSDKINHLEDQVSNLSLKIAEDNEESKEMEEKSKSLISQLKIQIEELSKEILCLKADKEDLTSNNQTFLQQVTELEAKIIEQKAVYDIKINKLERMNTDEKIEAKKMQDELGKSLQDSKDTLKLKEAEIDELKKSQNEVEARSRFEVNKLKETIEVFNSSNEDLKQKNEDNKIEKEKMIKSFENLNKEKENIEQKLKFEKNENEKFKEQINNVMKEKENLLKKVEDYEKKLDETTNRLQNVFQEIESKNQTISESKTSVSETTDHLHNALRKIEDLKSLLETRTSDLIECKEEIAQIKNSQSSESEEIKLLLEVRSSLEDKLQTKDRSLKLLQQRVNDLKKALQKEINKTHLNEKSEDLKQNNSSSKDSIHNHDDDVTTARLLSGETSLTDPGLNEDQRKVLLEYLKHVLLKFIACDQTEALQLVKAISMILHFSNDEEKLVREVLEYRSSWFSTKPSSKKLLKTSIKKSKHRR